MSVNRKSTSLDIAILAGVSQPTVSRALRGSSSVSEETRKRIEAIARQLNYTVDKNASSLRSRSSTTLALLFFEEAAEEDEGHINPFFFSILESITRSCARRGYDLLISFQQLSNDWHTDYEDSRKADGLILLGYGDYELYRLRLEQLVDQGTRFVLWGASRSGQPGVTVGCDNVQGGYEATAHLATQGRRRIAFIGNSTSRYPEFFARFRGYIQALAAHGLERDEMLELDAKNSANDGAAAVRCLIENGVVFDAIVAASDTVATGALRALTAAGLHIPHDVAVVGFDDIPAARLTSPALSSVVQDAGLAGQHLVGNLIAQVEGQAVEDVLLPVRLIVRESSGG